MATALLVAGPIKARQSETRLSGRAMATTYEVVYANPEVDPTALQANIDSLLVSLTDIFSTYDSNSTLSKINDSSDSTILHVVEDDFAEVFIRARKIYHDSDGAFNPAIGPLTLAWGIAAEPGDLPDESRLARLRAASEMSHFMISASQPWTIRKSDPEAALDYNGIAKGYAVDKISELLFQYGLDDFLVELGGEIRTAGNHPGGRSWQIAIEYPLVSESKAQTVLSIDNISVATSGNYRSVRYYQGRKIVHTIKPQSGLPEFNDLLSATVIAADCATADAYATALMVMGSEKAITFLSDRPHLDAYLMIGQDETNFDVYVTPGLKERIVEIE